MPLNAQGACGRVPDDLGVLVIVRVEDAALGCPLVVVGVLVTSTVSDRQDLTRLEIGSHHLVVSGRDPHLLTGCQDGHVVRPSMVVYVLPEGATVEDVEELGTTTNANEQLVTALVFVVDVHLLLVPWRWVFWNAATDGLLAVQRSADVSTAVEDDHVGQFVADLLPAVEGQQIGHALIGTFMFKEGVKLKSRQGRRVPPNGRGHRERQVRRLLGHHNARQVVVGVR